MSLAVQLVGSTIPSEPDLDGLVEHMRRLYIGSGMQLAINLGRLIVDCLFGGDPAKWQHNGRKEVSFRKLERHPGLPFRASTLSRSVAVYLLASRRGDLLEFRHLNASHLYEIVGLSADAQDALIRQAEIERWSVMRLRKEVRALVGTRRPSRRSAPGFAVWMQRLRGDLEARKMLEDLGLVDRLSNDEARELLSLVRALLQQGEHLARHLNAYSRRLPASSAPALEEPGPLPPPVGSRQERAQATVFAHHSIEKP